MTKATFKVIEAIPYKNLVWLVRECYLAWLNDKTEWKGTKVVWDISEGNKTTRIEMTHLGLVPGVECYKDCEAGWNQYVGESLPRLLTTGEGEAAPVGFSRRAQNPGLHDLSTPPDETCRQAPRGAGRCGGRCHARRSSGVLALPFLIEEKKPTMIVPRSTL